MFSSSGWGWFLIGLIVGIVYGAYRTEKLRKMCDEKLSKAFGLWDKYLYNPELGTM